ncbi:MAG: ATP-binding protein [Patescibacteria group bacterium]|nr:ATP-binding protein [Patescibacteria group bacterium]MCX7881207.1 ATP-binding protein [Patescibacteria group bacterium]
MVKRKVIDLIFRTIKKNPVIFITGPRQSGKTTLVKRYFADFVYFNLESPDVRLLFASDPKKVLLSNDQLIIDEIQRLPEMFSYIQTIVDENPKKRFVLTGSQNIVLSQKVSQTLAGRVAIFVLLPFSIVELKKTKFWTNDLDRLILKGFYPRIYDKNLNSFQWFQDYLQTYIEKDVREIKNIGNLLDFQRFLKLLAGRSGQILNLSSIASDVGVSVNTIKNWLSILQATYIITLIPPYYKNFNKRIIKSPKIYFLDSGLLCALLDIKNIIHLKTHPLYGNIYENFCVSEFLKQNFYQNLKINFYFWQDKTGREIDLIYELDNKIHAIEFKVSSTFNEDLIKNLLYFQKLTKKSAVYQLYFTDKEDFVFKNVKVKSWEKIAIES